MTLWDDPAVTWASPIQTWDGGIPLSDPPTPPTSLVAVAFSDTQIDLSWVAGTDDVGVTEYEVYQDGLIIASIPAFTSYSVTGLLPTTTYAFKLRSGDADGLHSGFSNTATATTLATAIPPDTVAPTVPTDLVAVGSGVQIELTWTESFDVYGVTGYEIYRDNVSLVVLGVITDYVDAAGLIPTIVYSYKVRAFDAAGNISGFSNTAQASIPIPPVEPIPTWGADRAGHRIRRRVLVN